MYRDTSPDLALLAFAGALFHQPSRDNVDMTLRIPCAPDEPTFGTGHHKHLCGSCNTAWKHDDMLPMFSTHEQFVESHSCPACGDEQLDKHF